MTLRCTMIENLEQAAGVGDLFREVYGEAYPIALYYQPDELWEATRAGQLHCAVATNDEGIVVAHCALYSTSPNPRVLEVGAGLVHASARREGAIARVFDVLLSFAKERNLCDWLMIDAVCNHVATQKLASRYDFVDTAIAVDHMPASTYAREGYAQGRVSALLSFFPIHDAGGKVGFPARYRDDLKSIYDRLGVQRQLLSTTMSPPAASRITAWRNEPASFLRVTVLEIGADLANHLEDEADVFQLVLPLDSHSLELAVAQAREKGFFLSGVLPAWTGSDNLMLQRLKNSTRWETIALETERARALLQTVRRDRETL